jgi:sulfotransferase family protein
MAAETIRLYGAAVARVLTRSRREGRGEVAATTERPVFVLGAPRSGTSFVARSIGQVPGFADLGELPPWKAAIPRLASQPEEEEAAAELRRTLEAIRRFGLVRRLRAVEQSPETAFVLDSVLRAYPQALVVHMVRDPRDVAASLVQKGWLREGRGGQDDIGEPYGHHVRFWVEPERAHEFDTASEARRAGWAWRRYVAAARGAPASTVEVRYEALAADPESASEPLAAHIGADPVLLARELGGMHAESIGRWRRNLTPEQVAEVEAEAGELMEELGYS